MLTQKSSHIMDIRQFCHVISRYYCGQYALLWADGRVFAHLRQMLIFYSTFAGEGISVNKLLAIDSNRLSIPGKFIVNGRIRTYPFARLCLKLPFRLGRI